MLRSGTLRKVETTLALMGTIGEVVGTAVVGAAEGTGTVGASVEILTRASVLVAAGPAVGVPTGVRVGVRLGGDVTGVAVG
mmetsp:Transcript_33475/g.70356  ORF Transcript_33475/g.70356 Transcript_33475/m.70356 type:complete len:81 (+) Transcript_33475:415-657(+)